MQINKRWAGKTIAGIPGPIDFERVQKEWDYNVDVGIAIFDDAEARANRFFDRVARDNPGFTPTAEEGRRRVRSSTTIARGFGNTRWWVGTRCGTASLNSSTTSRSWIVTGASSLRTTAVRTSRRHSERARQSPRNMRISIGSISETRHGRIRK